MPAGSSTELKIRLISASLIDKLQQSSFLSAHYFSFCLTTHVWQQERFTDYPVWFCPLEGLLVIKIWKVEWGAQGSGNASGHWIQHTKN